MFLGSYKNVPDVEKKFNLGDVAALSLSVGNRGSIHMAKTPLEKPLENPPDTQF